MTMCWANRALPGCSRKEFSIGKGAYLAGVAAERERAAKLADGSKVSTGPVPANDPAHVWNSTCNHIAAAIRRGPERPEDAK